MSKGKKKELYIVIFLLMMSLISMLVDLDLIVPLKTINISDDRINEIMLYIFSVQASVAILGIALLALLSEGSKEKKYGIYISDYIMNKRPYIFKHKYIIIFQLCLILFGYLFLLFEWLNLLVASLVISITLTILMTFSIFDLFIDRKTIHKNIKNYCIYHFDCPPTNKLLENKIQILEGLNNELISLSNENKILQLQESFSLYVEIFKILISKNSEEDILLFEKYFANGSKALLLTQDSNVISEVLKNIIQLYQLHNNTENNKIDKLRCVLQDLSTQYCKEKVHTFAPEIFL